MSGMLAGARGGEARRARMREGVAVTLGALMLVGMIGYMFVGDRPFKPDLLAASELSPINRYMWLGLLVLAVPVLWMRRARLGLVARAIWPLLLLFAWFVITTHWALDPAASTRRVLQICVSLVVVIAIVLGLDRPERMQFVACVPAIIIVTIDLLSWGVVPGIAMTPLGLQGMHGQKNVLGQYSMFTIICAGTCAFGAIGPWARRFLVAGTGVALLTLLASRSGTSAGLTFAAIGILPPLVVLLRKRGLVVASMLILLLGLIVLSFAVYLMWCGLAGADPLAPLAGVTFTKRTDLWAFLIENIHLRPWGGSGFGSFWAIDKAVQPSLNSGLWFGSGKEIAPEGHDAYLDLAATTGLTGLAMAVFVAIRAVIRGGQAVANAPAGMPLPTAAFHLAYVIMVLGHSFTESTVFGANNGLSTLFLLSVVTLEVARQQVVVAGALPHRRPLPRLRPAGVPGRSASPAVRATPGQR